MAIEQANWIGHVNNVPTMQIATTEYNQPMIWPGFDWVWLGIPVKFHCGNVVNMPIGTQWKDFNRLTLLYTFMELTSLPLVDLCISLSKDLSVGWKDSPVLEFPCGRTLIDWGFPENMYWIKTGLISFPSRSFLYISIFLRVGKDLHL